MVAVVTGASRGAGLAIARALGDAGATVYVTGRSRRGVGTTEGLAGTIEDAAAAVDGEGGRGIAAHVDHTRDDEVASLFDRVNREQGRIDLLVNNVWGGYEGYFDAEFDAPFWQQPLRRWASMFDAGVRAHFTSSACAAPIMIRQGSGLILSTVAWAFDRYMGNVLYDTSKAAIIRMVYGMAADLAPFGVSALAIAPGFMRTERVLAAHAVRPFDLSATESPAYLARGVAALALDPEVHRRSGRLVTVGELAREYGFTDVDGTQPPPFALPDGAAGATAAVNP